MMIVLIVISILIGLYLLWALDEELIIVPIGGFVVKLAVIIYLLVELIGIRVVNQKIELLSNQNVEIENKVASVVKAYMEHEHKTFTELKNNESYITLVTLYPELKSDKLIEKEIDLYVANNKEILNLKMQKLNESIYRWWLYFG